MKSFKLTLFKDEFNEDYRQGQMNYQFYDNNNLFSIPEQPVYQREYLAQVNSATPISDSMESIQQEYERARRQYEMAQREASIYGSSYTLTSDWLGQVSVDTEARSVTTRLMTEPPAPLSPPTSTEEYIEQRRSRRPSEFIAERMPTDPTRSRR